MTGQFSKPVLVVAAVATLGMSASAALAQTPSGVIPYLIDQRGVLARSGTGLCWRTGFWTPKLAAETVLPGAQFPVGCACDKDLMPKEVCEPPPPPPLVAEPPSTPEPAPVIAAAPVQRPPKHISLSADALFDFNKAELRPRGENQLSDIATKLQSAEYETITVVGHADRIGSPAYNQKLSEKRAEVVAKYLTEHGVHARTLSVSGKGKTEPVTTPDQCRNLKRKQLIECLQPDRRVDVDVKAIIQ